MNKDKLLDWAKQALDEKEYSKVSGYYEKYAESILFHDKEQAALYYSLAAQYEKQDFSQAIFLYQKSSKLYEQYGDKSSFIDISMAIGLLYQENGEEINASNEFKKCIALYLDNIKDTILQKSNLLKPVDSENLFEQLDKIKFCIKQVTLEEKI